MFLPNFEPCGITAEHGKKCETPKNTKKFDILIN
jgi:hypothetical protein